MTPAPRLHLVTDPPTPADGQPAAGSLWDVPVPVTGPSTAPPPFPVDVFPRWLGDMVTGVARFTQTDPAMAGTLAVAVLSACAGGRLEVEPVAGWREPVNVFAAVIAGPGERKSPVHRAMTAPLFAAQSTLSEAMRPKIAEAAALRDIADRQAEQTKAQAAKVSDKRDEAAAEAVAAAIAAEAITVPGLPRLIVDDATPEALIGLMAANGGRMAIISDEGGIFDTLAGRYSGAPNLDPYLKGHAGQPMSNERQTREGASVDKPALTVCVMAQPTVLRKFGGNADLAGRGLPARFLFALPRSLAGYRAVDTPPVAEPVTAGYRRRVHDLAKTLADWEDPAVVVLTEEAGQVRRAAAEQVEAELRPGGSLYDMREWGNKLSGATLRLAGLLHVAHHPADAWQQPIGADRMTDAVRLAEFFAAHYRAALTTIGTDTAIENTRYVLGVLTTKAMTTFTRRELHRRVIRRLPKSDEVSAVLAELAALGWVRNGPDGRYELHPRAAAEDPESVDALTPPPDGDVSAGHDASEGVNGPR
ncbi:YfjI family protein [Micromonospora sp. WMMA1363]|uniref:YfjI family protein n=1 Tax=Micromonospora sp. WMMA1363 TaxID=3053985 RepID=UPI00259C9819|nr:YfjI family protein [Micromonospora sp. WMMA1363]MDM4720880.1 YfjI family protein [Micromonospora sp. WMMA1363]